MYIYATVLPQSIYLTSENKNHYTDPFIAMGAIAYQ